MDMRKAPFQPCTPTRGTKVPDHPDWLHEVKHDGFRLIVERDHDRVRLFTRNGYDWSSRYPLIAEAARRIKTNQFVLDGEAVLLGVDGISDFDGLYSEKHNDEIQLYAFDILALDGDDLRKLPLHLRKNNLARLLARRADGIHLAPFEQGEIGPDLFKAACDMMLEGLVSKRRDSRYQAGTSRDWIKVKNQAHPAMTRVKDAHNGRSR
jgi:bifunctional non-homologous end joining protein LigD